MLLLCVDTSEQRPGVGAVDMAFVVNVNQGKVVKLTPVYPGGLAHPTMSPTADMRSNGVDRLYLHDSLWSDDVEKGSKIAQEIVEYHTGLKTDLVVIVTPESIDAIINSIGPIYVKGQGYVSGNSVEFLREEQDKDGMSGQCSTVPDGGYKTAIQDPSNRKILMETGFLSIRQGKHLRHSFKRFPGILVYEGINTL